MRLCKRFLRGNSTLLSALVLIAVTLAGGLVTYAVVTGQLGHILPPSRSISFESVELVTDTGGFATFAAVLKNSGSEPLRALSVSLSGQPDAWPVEGAEGLEPGKSASIVKTGLTGYVPGQTYTVVAEAVFESGSYAVQTSVKCRGLSSKPESIGETGGGGTGGTGGGGSAEPSGELVNVIFNAHGLGADASGVVLVVDGVGYSRSDLPKAFRWASGETHSFEWRSPVSGSTGVRYVWSSTSGLSTARSGTITVPSGGGSVQAAYSVEYQLTISVSPSGAGTTNPAPGTYWHNPGDSVQISVAANSGYAFDCWVGSGSGSYSGTSSSATITVNGPITQTAYFFSFSISVSPDSGFCQQGEGVSATVTVTLSGGYSSSVAVSLSASGLPSGASASFSPSSVTVSPSSPTASSTMTISTSSSTPADTYTVTITGNGGGLTKTATYTLTVLSAQVQVQLREFDKYSTANPDIRFSIPQAGVLRLDSYTGGDASNGMGYVFFELPRSLLNGKRLEIRWNVYFTYADSRDLYIGSLYVFNGVFDRRDMTSYFKPNTNSEPIFSYATYILATHYPGPQGRSGWLGWRVDTSDVLDLSSWTSDYVTVLIRICDDWTLCRVMVDVDYVKVLDASGSVVWALNFDGSITMERSGTTNDYGLFIGE